MTSAAAEGLRCENCGAAAARAAARFCEYCGKALPTSAARPPSPDELLERRFQELENHPELQRHLQWTPGPEVVARGALGGVGTVVVLAILLFFFVPLFSRGPLFFPVIPWLMIGLVVVGLVRRSRYLAAPLERVIAVVADERQHSEGHGDSPRTTRYFATLERRDGTRSEYKVTGRLAGEVRPGDMGVGYVKGGTLVAFRRLRV